MKRPEESTWLAKSLDSSTRHFLKFRSVGNELHEQGNEIPRKVFELRVIELVDSTARPGCNQLHLSAIYSNNCVLSVISSLPLDPHLEKEGHRFLLQ
jgi:hypothetical protein